MTTTNEDILIEERRLDFMKKLGFKFSDNEIKWQEKKIKELKDQVLHYSL